MIKKFKRTITTTQSKLAANIVPKTITQQCSYNLDLDMERFLFSKKMIERLTPVGTTTSVNYGLAPGCAMILGENIFAVIGDSYKTIKNKVVFTHTEGVDGSTKKFQLKKTEFDGMHSSDYKWFVDLYNKNIENLNFVAIVDDTKKTVTFDLELTAAFFATPTFETAITGVPTSHFLNQILYGAPGTGKTYNTATYALAIIENVSKDSIEAKYPTRALLMAEYNKQVSLKRIYFTTFHQNYSYEDFVVGLRPDTTTPMKFNDVDGIFKIICEKAKTDLDNNYVLIIDEINRANISKVFGELITLIEPDKRDGEINAITAVLPNGKPFSVPKNVYILGTMNSADKSISLIDAALRRRFKFIEISPDAGLITTDPEVKELLIELNNQLFDKLNSTDLLIGHSYFLGATVNDLEDIINSQIIPLLYEYFLDNATKVKEVLTEALKKVTSITFNIKSEKFRRIYIKK